MPVSRSLCLRSFRSRHALRNRHGNGLSRGRGGTRRLRLIGASAGNGAGGNGTLGLTHGLKHFFRAGAALIGRQIGLIPHPDDRGGGLRFGGGRFGRAGCCGVLRARILRPAGYGTGRGSMHGRLAFHLLKSKTGIRCGCQRHMDISAACGPFRPGRGRGSGCRHRVPEFVKSLTDGIIR